MWEAPNETYAAYCNPNLSGRSLCAVQKNCCGPDMVQDGTFGTTWEFTPSGAADLDYADISTNYGFGPNTPPNLCPTGGPDDCVSAAANSVSLSPAGLAPMTLHATAAGKPSATQLRLPLGKGAVGLSTTAGRSATARPSGVRLLRRVGRLGGHAAARDSGCSLGCGQARLQPHGRAKRPLPQQIPKMAPSNLAADRLGVEVEPWDSPVPRLPPTPPTWLAASALSSVEAQALA